MTFITKKASSPAHVSPRRGRHAGAAAARVDGAGANAAAQDGRGPKAASAASTCRTAPRWTSGRPREGTGFEFTEILQPLEPFRDRVNVVSDLAHPQAGGVGADAGADHTRSAAIFLSGAHPGEGPRCASA